MRVFDPGHTYFLDVLDGRSRADSALQFVKRIGAQYPGNEPPAYAGTTMQEVLRALIDRAGYVNRQIPCVETEAAIGHLKGALLLLEIRAKRVNGKCLDAADLGEIIDGATCRSCGHVKCTQHGAPLAHHPV